MRTDNTAGVRKVMLAAAKAGLMACTRDTTGYPSDCPNSAILSGGKNVKWQLVGDPTAGATVRYDGSTAQFSVNGRVDMTLDQDGELFTNAHHTSTTTYPFMAILFWDGTQVVLVTIQP